MLKNIQNIKLIILAEGITEKILLPEFAKVEGLDFNKNGIKIISSGGKNRLLRLYKKLIHEVKIPIFMIFDSDAAGLIEPNYDAYVIANGEFEDILPDELIFRALSDHYRLSGEISFCEIAGKNSKVEVLTNLYKQKGFGDFRKAEFARIIASYIKTRADLSDELRQILKAIKEKQKIFPCKSFRP